MDPLARARAAIRVAQLEQERAIRNLAAIAAEAPRRCAGCDRVLSRYAAATERYCAPCHPGLEVRAGAILAGRRWHPEDAGEVHQAAVELAARRHA